MMIDLEQALSDLARSAHDDDVTDRMTGRVRTMVGRIRRRRAARHTATGVVGLGAVAGLTIGGVQLLDRTPAPVPPVATDPTPHLVTGALLRCGESASAPTDLDETGLGLVTEFAESPGAPEFVGGDVPPVPVDVRLVNGTDVDVTVRRTEVVILAVVRDGVVVSLSGSGEPDTTIGDLSPGTGYTMPAYAALRDCATGEPLPAGRYELVAAITVEDVTHDAVVSLVGAPVGFTIADPPPAGATAAREERIQAIIAESDRISAEYPFGTCGTRVPEDRDDQLLEIDADLESRSLTAGSPIEGTARITATDGLVVLGNAPVTAAHVVLTRDGVVVGRGHYEPGVDVTEFSTDPTVLPVIGNAVLCALPGADAPEVDLPPGTYQAYTTLDVALKEILYPDGTAESRSDLIVVPSRPVDVVIE